MKKASWNHLGTGKFGYAGVGFDWRWLYSELWLLKELHFFYNSVYPNLSFERFRYMKPRFSLQMLYLLQGLFWESLHAIGESILFFMVLPYMDSTIAFLLLPLVSIIPTLCDLHAKSLSLYKNRRGAPAGAQAKRRAKLYKSIICTVSIQQKQTKWPVFPRIEL